MSITHWQQTVAQRVNQFLLKLYKGQAEEFDFGLSCSSIPAHCSWWSLSFKDGKFSSQSIRVLVVTYPEDSWEFLGESIEFRVEFSTGISSLSEQQAVHIVEVVREKLENNSENWKVVEEDGVSIVKYYLKNDAFGSDDADLADAMLGFCINHALKIADYYHKTVKELL